MGSQMSTPRTDAFSPDKALDGDFSTYSHTKTVQPFRWIAIQLSEDSLQLVRKVVVVNFVSSAANAARFKNAEVFISTSVPTTATKKFDGGNLLGSFPRSRKVRGAGSVHQQ